MALASLNRSRIALVAELIVVSERIGLCFAEWHGEEWLAAFRAIASGHVASGPAIERLCDALVAVLGGKAHVELVGSGRVALGLALAVFRQRRSRCTQVIVPAYICDSVVDTVRAAGLEPVFVDIGSDLNLTVDGVANALDARVLAVIAPHMYACPAPISALESLCQDAGVYLVDDAAQVLGVTQEGRPLGTFGDVGLLSFAQSKTVVTGVLGSGGALVINRTDWSAPMRTICDSLPAPQRRLRAWMHFVLNYLAAPYLGPFGQLDYYLAAAKLRVGMPQRAQQLHHYYDRTRISGLESAIALPQIARLPDYLTARRGVLELYARALAGSEIIFPQFTPGRYLSKVVLLLPKEQVMSETRRRLAAAGVASRRGYPARSEGGRVAEWAPRLLEVPSFSGMPARQVERVCEALRSRPLKST